MHGTWTRAAGALALALVVGAPSAAQEAASLKGTYTRDAEAMGKKLVELSEAMGADTYGWRPMDGVRSVSEVFMLIAAEFYAIPSAWGASAPDGVPAGNAAFSALAKVTDKAEVVRHMKESSVFFNKAVADLPESRFGEKIQFFGRERTVSEALYLILGDMHEHLGQAIAYARSNQVVPPWTARRGS